ncbi:MAG: glutaminase [Paraglaciecola sp.]|jgi:glutaminase|tara:strand:+ start:1536 stop:1745 length:210 start_codon:yes stop_codon:yes gene_type:complete
MQKIVDEIAAKMALRTDKGNVARYIPQLACVDPEQFSISVALPNGSVYSAGCAGSLFSIQSISKMYCLR